LVIAGITIVWGNLGALRQRELKRLLGYSSMTHSGYLLFGTVAVSALGAEAMIFYLVQYLFTSLACFFVLGALARNGHGSTLDELAGLSKRAPFLSWALLASLLSMAGIPPLSGFLAKFLVFSAVPDYSGYEALYFTVLSLALVGVVVSAVYYLGVARVLWADGPREAPVQPTSSALWLGLAACVAVILVLGIYQDPVLRAAERASASLGLQ
jgi:NADH-quinone oxidoreductase subunit N